MRAARLAELADGRSRHGAIIVKGGAIYGWGISKSRTHNAWVYDRPRVICSIHAEVSAVRSVDSCNSAVLYVARVNRSGMLRRSTPCNNCKEFLSKTGIRKVIAS